MKRSAKVNHLAIIPDGNRRWSEMKNIFDDEKIYQKGTKRLGEIMEAVAEREIRFLTLWASSLANLKERSTSFRETMNLFYTKRFNELAVSQMVRKRRVKIQVFGEWEENLDESAVEAIQNVIQTTAKNEEKIFTILVGYDGKRERGSAITELIKDISNKMFVYPKHFDEAEAELRKRAWTGHLPNVDLLIRTGSWEDPHLSADFLTFLIGEVQLVFPEVFWPDFSKKELHKILLAYDNRERRFGK